MFFRIFFISDIVIYKIFSAYRISNILCNLILGHPRIEPRHFVNQDIVESYSKKYMFLGCIEFISKVWKDV